MTDLEKIELAIRRTAARLSTHDSSDAETAISIALEMLADEIVTAEQARERAKKLEPL